MSGTTQATPPLPEPLPQGVDPSWRLDSSVNLDRDAEHTLTRDQVAVYITGLMHVYGEGNVHYITTPHEEKAGLQGVMDALELERVRRRVGHVMDTHTGETEGDKTPTDPADDNAGNQPALAGWIFITPEGDRHAEEMEALDDSQQGGDDTLPPGLFS